MSVSSTFVFDKISIHSVVGVNGEDGSFITFHQFRFLVRQLSYLSCDTKKDTACETTVFSFLVIIWFSPSTTISSAS